MWSVDLIMSEDYGSFKSCLCIDLKWWALVSRLNKEWSEDLEIDPLREQERIQELRFKSVFGRSKN